MADYAKYSHVRRLGTAGTEDYLKGTVIATPKVDGANCCVYLDEETQTPAIGGRNRPVEDKTDIAWLGDWFDTDKREAPALKKFVEDNPNLIVYGERLGGQTKDKFQGAIKDYDKKYLRTVQIFDVYDANAECYLGDEEWRKMIAREYPELTEFCVPILGIFENPTEEELWALAEKNTYMLDEAGHAGEGIVLRNPDFRDEYGNYHIVKMVLSDWKQQANKRSKEKIAENIEAAIVAEYMTDAEMEKTAQKTCAKFGDDVFDATSKKHMGFFTSVIFKDLLEENIMDIMKRFGKPTIDFGKLSGLATRRGNEWLAENGYITEQ